MIIMWGCNKVVITTAQFHSIKLELRFCAGSNLAHKVSDLQWGEFVASHDWK